MTDAALVSDRSDVTIGEKRQDETDGIALPVVVEGEWGVGLFGWPASESCTSLCERMTQNIAVFGLTERSGVRLSTADRISCG